MEIPADGELVLTDLISFDTLLRMYEGGYKREKEQELEGYEDMCVLNATVKLEVEKAGIVRKKAQRDRDGALNMHLDMPEINRKVITTVARKAAFDKAFEKYKKERDAYRMSVFLVGKSGKAPLEFVADQKSTVQDLLEAFREARMISEDTHLSIQWRFGDLELETRVLEIAPLMPNELVEVTAVQR
jgi:hypothetical protein